MSTHNSHSKKHLRKDQNTIGLCPFISATESQNLINSYNQANPKVFLMANGQLHSLPVLYTVQNHNQFLICGMMLDKPNHILYLNYMNLFFFHKLRISMNKTTPSPTHSIQIIVLRIFIRAQQYRAISKGYYWPFNMCAVPYARVTGTYTDHSGLSLNTIS